MEISKTAAEDDTTENSNVTENIAVVIKTSETTADEDINESANLAEHDDKINNDEDGKKTVENGKEIDDGGNGKLKDEENTTIVNENNNDDDDDDKKETIENSENIDDIIKITEDDGNENSSKITTAKDIKEVFCVRYPGVVKNPDKAISNLGGVKSISRSFLKNHKLECRLSEHGSLFRRPTIAEPSKTRDLVISIVRGAGEGKQPDDSKKLPPPRVKVIGRITKTVEFNTLVDFQYLPVKPDDDDVHRRPKDITAEIIPTGIPSYESLFEPCTSLFLSPTLCSKVDTPSAQKILLAATTTTADNVVTSAASRGGGGAADDHEDEDECEKIKVAVSRPSRRSYVRFVSGDTFTVPSEPDENAPSKHWQRDVNQNYINVLKQCFEQRPVWTKSGLLCVSGLPRNIIKDMLPAVAYHFSSGPFRTGWVRYGCDPRRDHECRSYQTFDYRIKGKILNLVQDLNSSSSSSSRNDAATSTTGVGGGDIIKHYGPKVQYAISRYIGDVAVCNRRQVDDYNEDNYIFKPGVIPPYKQMFYQICDIKIPLVRHVLKSSSSAESTYDDKFGWFSPRIFASLRASVNNYIFNELSNETLSVPSSSSSSFGRTTADNIISVDDGDEDAEENAFSDIDNFLSDDDEDSECTSSEPTHSTGEHV